MPAVAAITINDGKTTPIAHVFTPIGVEQGVASFEDNSGGIPVGSPRLTVSLARPKPNQKVYRVRVKIDLPVLEVLGTVTSGFNPAPTVAYNVSCDVTFVLPTRSSLSDRKDIRALLVNALSNLNISSVVTDLAGFY